MRVNNLVDYSNVYYSQDITTTRTKTVYITSQYDGILAVSLMKKTAGNSVHLYINDNKIFSVSSLDNYLKDSFSFPIQKGDTVSLNDDGASFSVYLGVYKYKD